MQKCIIHYTYYNICILDYIDDWFMYNISATHMKLFYYFANNNYLII